VLDLKSSVPSSWKAEPKPPWKSSFSEPLSSLGGVLLLAHEMSIRGVDGVCNAEVVGPELSTFCGAINVEEKNLFAAVCCEVVLVIMLALLGA